MEGPPFELHEAGPSCACANGGSRRAPSRPRRRRGRRSSSTIVSGTPQARTGRRAARGLLFCCILYGLLFVRARTYICLVGFFSPSFSPPFFLSPRLPLVRYTYHIMTVRKDVEAKLPDRHKALFGFRKIPGIGSVEGGTATEFTTRKENAVGNLRSAIARGERNGGG